MNRTGTVYCKDRLPVLVMGSDYILRPTCRHFASAHDHLPPLVQTVNAVTMATCLRAAPLLQGSRGGQLSSAQPAPRPLVSNRRAAPSRALRGTRTKVVSPPRSNCRCVFLSQTQTSNDIHANGHLSYGALLP